MRFKGFIAAAFTPMHEDGSIVLEKVPTIVDYSIKSKFAALFVNGSTGEFAALSTEERMRMAEAYVCASAKRIPIIVHVGSSSVEQAAILAAHAREIGADAVGALAPFYFRPANAHALAASLKTMAAACNPLPFYYYHIPVLTGMNIHIYDLLKIVENEIPNFAGVKFTHEDLMDYQRSLEYASDRFQIMFGRDEIILAALALGAEAGVGSTFNFAPRIYHRILESFTAGDLAKARYWQGRSQALISFLPRYGFAAQKMMMKFAGIDVGIARQPITNMNVALESELREKLEKAELLELLG